MKRFVFLMMFGLCLICASAQNTKIVRGAVIDRNGNPIPNALVEATGGAESVTTDADGTFSMEVPIWLKSMTAQYAGMRPKKLNLEGRSELLFELKPERKFKWFAALLGTVNFGGAWTGGGGVDISNFGSKSGDKLTYGGLGIMGGILANWGGYVKLIFSPSLDYGEVPSVSAGVIKQIKDPFYVYLGAGFAPSRYYEYWKWYGWNGGLSSNYKYTEYDAGGMIDLGAIYLYKNFVFNFGYSLIIGDDASDHIINNTLQFGVGYAF